MVPGESSVALRDTHPHQGRSGRADSEMTTLSARPDALAPSDGRQIAGLLRKMEALNRFRVNKLDDT
jgi:hypothetical protein